MVLLLSDADAALRTTNDEKKLGGRVILAMPYLINERTQAFYIVFERSGNRFASENASNQKLDAQIASHFICGRGDAERGYHS